MRFPVASILIILIASQSIQAQPQPSPLRGSFARSLASLQQPVWETVSDSNTKEDRLVTCFEQKDRLNITSTSGSGTIEDPDHFTIKPDPWVSGALKFGCQAKDAYYRCIKSCHPFDGTSPNWSSRLYLTFVAKVSGNVYVPTCKPRIHLTGGGWPRSSSNLVTLEGSYVEFGQLVSDQWRRVVIPLADLKTSTWSLTNIYGLYFDTCGTSHTGAQPTYRIAHLTVGDVAPVLRTATPPPTPLPTAVPTAHPTVDVWPIWKTTADGHTREDAEVSCYEQGDRLGIESNDGGLFDLSYFSVRPDNWVAGGLRFGCVAKDANYNCIQSCYPFDGNNPDWSDKLYLTFQAKYDDTLSPLGCKPKMHLTGGGWPRQSSQVIALQEEYVDAGHLVSDEWRQVVIPMEDLKTPSWDLSGVYALYFQNCGDLHSVIQPTYHIADLAVTNTPPELLSTPPSSSPSEFVSDDPLLATHRMCHHHWYPIFGADREPAGKSWVEAEDNSWPIGINVDAEPQTVTVRIPRGQSVVYSGADSTKYDKIIVEGSLTIRPDPSGDDVSLTVGTIVVEMDGALDIRTNQTGQTVHIQIEGALDTSIDPEQFMVGILSLGGNVTMMGDPVSSKMAPLGTRAVAGTNVLVVSGTNLNFAVDGELVIPDTQKGLDVTHWNFVNSGTYFDQTEVCKIKSVSESATTSEVVCESPLAFDHSSGCNVAYMTRSIKLSTSPLSISRGHIFNTGEGLFEVRHVQIQHFGRTTTNMLNSTVMYRDTELKFEGGMARMNVASVGTNQIARYALHAHHSRVEGHFVGNSVYDSPRDGMVAHDSRVHIIDNVIVGADGSGIFLEDGTETGPVLNNYIIGTGGGSRGHDDSRFASRNGTDMAHGGFGVWARGLLALVQGNHAEGHFGRSPYAFFVHPNFISDNIVPNVPGTPSVLVGKSLKQIAKAFEYTGGMHLQTYGGFINNSAVATFQVGLDMSYFGGGLDDHIGSIIQGANIQALAISGSGLSTTHSRIFTLNDVTLEGMVQNNTMTGIWCNNLGNGETLEIQSANLIIENVAVIRGGNC